MASDIKTTEDADMECDGEKVVTMMDVLQEQEEFEEDANAVLGASDDKNCTYSKGYIKRQAIYACLTCCSEAKSDPTKRAGVCLACSLMCHENHELIELYTKRNFRCDCGNPKFSSHPCTFTSDKTELNDDNSYNQNFSGLYCTCHRPYPDPESTVEDEMIQCIVCEDWLHASHLESSVPANDLYTEMICKGCMEKNEFLHDYSELAVNTENIDVDIVNGDSDTNNSTLCNGDTKTEDTIAPNSNETKSDIETTETAVTLETSILETEVNDDQNSTEAKKNIENKENNDGDNTLRDEKQEDSQTDSAMDTEQSEEAKKIESATEEPSTSEKSLKTDDIAQDTTNKPALSDEDNSNSIEQNVQEISDENKDSDKPIEQKDSHQDHKPNDDNITTDLKDEKTETEAEKETNDLNTEKMEEDRLLNDSEDDNKKNVSADSTEDDTLNGEIDSMVTKDKEERKLESEQNSDENSQTTDEKLDAVESENARTESNEMESDTNTATKRDSSIKNKIQSESLPEGETEKDKNDIENKNDIQNESNEVEASSQKVSEKRKFEEENPNNIDAKKPKIDSICIRPKGVKRIYNGATFWPSNFRQKLCTCPRCISMYNDLSVLFLTDPEDTVSAYENLGKEKTNGKPSTQYEKGLQALSSLDRIQQINALTEYNRMRDKLLDFLKSFKDKKEIVKEEDIKAFFAGIRPKREQDGVYFCR